MTPAGLEAGAQKQMSVSARILLIEDSEPDVFLVREALEQCELSVGLEVLEDGERAVVLIDRIDHEGIRAPDLILLDLNLPKRSGAQVLERIRRSPVCVQTPVVIFTSSDSPKDKAQTAELGATFFRKPSRLNEFMMLGPLVERLLKENKLPRS
jgi:DNA-binding response OmpR family regulator